jgi:large subunit ribosomal protein L7/L12
MSKVQELISEIKNLSIIETLELVEKLQSEFGVSAASMAMPAQTATVDAVAVKTNFKVELIDIGAEKTKVIKALRVVKKELGLIEAKNATENLPYLVFAESNKEDTDNAKKILEEAGAKLKVS